MDLKQFIKESGNEYASIVADGVAAGDVNSYIDTGIYLFNSLLSGSIFGGLPSNKITALAGESATGKTYFLMGIVKTIVLKPVIALNVLVTEESIPPDIPITSDSAFDGIEFT